MLARLSVTAHYPHGEGSAFQLLRVRMITGQIRTTILTLWGLLGHRATVIPDCVHITRRLVTHRQSDKLGQQASNLTL